MRWILAKDTWHLSLTTTKVSLIFFFCIRPWSIVAHPAKHYSRKLFLTSSQTKSKLQGINWGPIQELIENQKAEEENI
jgi:hypothetical protein